LIERGYNALVDEAPPGNDWLHEIKYDGYRTHARIGGSVELLTRTGLDWSHRYPRAIEASQFLRMRRGRYCSASEGSAGKRSASPEAVDWPRCVPGDQRAGRLPLFSQHRRASQTRAQPSSTPLALNAKSWKEA
jgi:hypothetical protein